MASRDLFEFAALHEFLERVGSRRLEQPIPRRCAAEIRHDERLRNQVRGAVDEIRAGDLVNCRYCTRRPQCEAAGEDRQAPQDHAFGLREQVIAPVKRCPQRLVPRQRRAAATRQQVETISEAGRELFDPERIRTRCRQLDWLVRYLEHRIGDKRIIHLIQKWLRAGILEDGVVTVDDRGTGQGSVISPLLANIYLHYCFDLWAERWRQHEARGDMIVVRYADDLVAGFEHESDARRFLDAMRDRLGKFALSLHPDKTRLIEFGRFAATDRKLRGLGKPETFTFLGFTFICGLSRRGNFQLQRKTRRDRMLGKLKDIKAELRRRMHQPIPEQGRWLRQVVTGHFAYYAVPTNSRALSAFRHHVTDLWRRTLRRRSQKDGFTWDRMTRLVDDWLPQPRILHPWPDVRFDIRHPR